MIVWLLPVKLLSLEKSMARGQGWGEYQIYEYEYKYEYL